ncbi:MAG TPA: RagB/SusD family nutrient uptake outer membrane protein [Sphingobacteriaceae bacterium]
MKRKYIQAAGALAMFLALASCEKELNIEPRQDISAELALSTPQDVQNALTGGYAVMGFAQLYGTNLIMLPELLANDSYVQWVGTFDSYTDVSDRNMISTNAEATRTWTSGYRAINVANTVLSALDVIQDTDTRNSVEAGALFIRAAMHFELVRLYALPYEAGAANSQPGVPLMLEAVKTTDNIHSNKARNTVAEVYTQVEADLTSAISKDPGNFAAQAMLARVYLQAGKFPEARDMANAVITNGGYSLAGLEEPFRVDHSDEGIFEIEQDEQVNAGTSNDGLTTFFASLPGDVGRAELRVDAAFAASFEPNDLRRTELIYAGRAGGLFTQKWSDYYDNIPVLRLTEMYLTRAEANFREGTAVGATPLADINMIRQRAGLLPLLTLTVDQILSEREKELAFEGFRLHDYKRTKRSIGAYDYDSPELVLPIPDREINANPALVQNEGY